MGIKRRCVALLLGMVLCGGLFAQNILDTYFDGDELNRRLRNYTTNVSNLIPDSTTLSNVWSAPPSAGVMFGAGVNGSITLLDRKKVGSLIDSAEGFGGSHKDLSEFPEAIPFLPGASVDVRAGGANVDVGLCGMWVDTGILLENLGTGFLGDGSSFSYRSFGIDVRAVLIREREDDILFGLVDIGGAADFVPTVTLQAGYYFTWFDFGIEAGKEKASVEFRNDSYLLALQTSYTLGDARFGVTPYVGAKVIFSNTDSGYSWKTDRPVVVQGQPYPDGARHTSGGIDGDTYTYFQIYGGVGVSLIFSHLLTVGVAYNVNTSHFGVNAAVRVLF